MDELTTDDVRHWDLSVIHQMFETAANRRDTKHQLGEALLNGRNRTADWRGEGAEAFREEEGKFRTDVNAAGRESDRVYRAVRNAEMWVSACKASLDDIEATAEGYGWTITQDWKVDTGEAGTVGLDDSLAVQEQLLQTELDKLKTNAHIADHDLAVALRAAVGDAELDARGNEVHGQPGPQPQPDQHPPRDVGSQERPGVTDVNDPGVTWQPGFDPNTWRNSWHNPMLADNPPGYTGGPGPARDQAWQNYLAHFPRDQRGFLPNPDAVTDPGLRVVGNAATQLGTSYAWGANQNTSRPTGGTLNGDPPGGGAHVYHDDQRVGFDCGGLVRYSVSEGIGHDPFEHTGPPGAGTDLLDTSRYLTPVEGGVSGASVSKYAQPGDVLVFGNSGHEPFSGTTTHHTGIYVGNGIILNAPESGLPVQADPLSQWAREPTDILRPTP